jgi:hypothetical protein
MADFEALTKKPTRVWAWGVCELGKKRVTYGTTIDEFMEWCFVGPKDDNKHVYFHNLSYDGVFIFNGLFANHYRYEEKEKTDMTFNALIDSAGKIYYIEVIYKKYSKRYCKVTFYDSLKKLPFKVKEIGPAFGFEMSKGDIDYHKDRPEGYELTPEEIDYLQRDVRIVSDALMVQYKQGLNGMTIGMDALRDYKSTLDEYEFKILYPTADKDLDLEMREAYKGGFTYLKKGMSEKDLGAGIVLDVNSLYPWVQYTKLMPYGIPVPFDGEYRHSEYYPLYIQKLRCDFTLKPGHLPTIQEKNAFRNQAAEYIETTRSRPRILHLTNVDLQLMFDHYDVEVHEWLGGWMFKGAHGLFEKYIDKWMGEKVKAEKNGNPALRSLSKLMLNSLGGKFGSNPKCDGKIPYLDPIKKIVRYEAKPTTYKKPVYIASAAFMTSYARELTIRTGQKFYDRYIYSDTDSLHLLGTELPEGIEVHPTNLGAWKFEYEFTRARYLKAKLYRQQKKCKYGPEEAATKGAGMTDTIKPQVTWENFHFGTTYEGKLQKKNVDGGVILEVTTFTIEHD